MLSHCFKIILLFNYKCRQRICLTIRGQLSLYVVSLLIIKSN